MTRLTTAEKAELLEYAAELLDNDEEQASGTDVLPADQAKSDCSGCPLHQAKQHKSDTVSVELTRAELDWLLIAVLINPWSNIKNLTIGNRIYAKLEKLDK